jgi:murein DD-endopeptidase MepM/ murein hydrolase activator NlpD
MGLASRASLFVTAALALGACATGEHKPAPIDFRGSSPVVRSPVHGTVMASAVPSSAQQPKFNPAEPGVTAPYAAPSAVLQSNAPAPLQLVADLGPSVGLSATDEARAMTAQPGGRPGGARRVAADDPAARTITVIPGDTLYDISRRYNVNMRALIETNRIAPPYALNVGGKILLPPPNVHVVQRGETLYAVSRRYNVDVRSMALLNGLTRPWTVYPGDELLLPPLARDQARAPVSQSQPVVVAAVAPPPVAKPVATKPAVADDKPIQLAPTPKPKPAAAVVPPLVAKPAVAATPAPKPVAKPVQQPVGSRDFIWPVSGNVVKGYGAAGGGRNDGVNIAAAKGTPIKAAAGGEVVYAGSELAGFGNLILIRHPGGWVTAYGHADTMTVREGDLVKQGQAIGTVGSTGNAGSPQVHFELRKGKEPVDPAGHLPPL